jgi:hypothetical protein
MEEEGAVVEVGASDVVGVVAAGSVDGVNEGLDGAVVVEGAFVEVAGSVVAGVVLAGSVDAGGGCVVGAAVDEVGTGVVAGCVGGVPLCWANWVMMRRTAADWV